MFARGCESYYRVTGEIAGCSDISTENARKRWIEKYSICLEIQLSEEIAAYYANQPQYDLQKVPLDGLSSLDDQPESPPSTSLRQSLDYQGDTSFCPR